MRLLCVTTKNVGTINVPSSNPKDPQKYIRNKTKLQLCSKDFRSNIGNYEENVDVTYDILAIRFLWLPIILLYAKNGYYVYHVAYSSVHWSLSKL